MLLITHFVEAGRPIAASKEFRVPFLACLLLKSAFTTLLVIPMIITKRELNVSP